jgi:hypothetical protein
MVASSPQFAYVPENTNFFFAGDTFLDLFPHWHSYLWAEHPRPGERPNWQSEDRHPLSDRLILQGSYLYGVRFGKATRYLMLDIDAHSQYHPSHDPYAITRILEALEPIGLHRYIAVSSSYSGGIHLYFPFTLSQTTWKLANTAATLLESAGIVPTPGHLELFPNARRYAEGTPSQFNGHRLPLQNGSYLLNDDWQPTFTTHDRFVEQWHFTQSQNPVREETLDRLLKQYERRRWSRFSQGARKFLDDLNAEIELGWTDFGQTNWIVGRIAIREYVFFHVLHGNGTPLTGTHLICRIAEVAESLPGYEEFCQHQGEIYRLALYWGRAVESSPNYYPYGGNAIAADPPSVEATWNQQQASDARERIQTAVEELSAAGQFPDGIRARIFALKSKGIGVDSLYKNKDLWYGEKQLKPAPDGVIPPVQADLEGERSPEPAPAGVIPPVALISFVGDPDCPPNGADPEAHTEKPGGSGGGFPQADPPDAVDPPRGGIEHVRRALASLQRRRAAAPPPASSPPPDETWFQQQLSLWQLAPPTLAGQGRDPTRIQLPQSLEGSHE